MQIDRKHLASIAKAEGHDVEEQPVDTTIYSLSKLPPAASSDRRQSDRQMTLYRVGSVTIDKRRELCLIKNISAGGMLIRAYCAMPEGTPLGVELKNGQPIRGKVQWAQDHDVGVIFDEPIDVIEILTASMAGPRPRMPRIEIDCFATIRDGGTVYRMHACDISQGGIKLATGIVIPPGSDVAVTIAGLAPIAGMVRWTHAGYCGITFNRLLALPQLVNWLQGQRGGLRATG